MKLVILGLSITSSWGNGHAVTWRALASALDMAGHDVLFLERDVPWYAAHRDLPAPPYGRTALYASVDDLLARFGDDIRDADAVIIGSYVPDAIPIADRVFETARGVRAFYDIDTPVTLAALDRGECRYLTPAQVAAYDLYLSFTGGPTLDHLEARWQSPRARALYCSADPMTHRPESRPHTHALGYLGTYSDDRQPRVEALLCAPARRLPDRRFSVVGPQYPDHITWPRNVERVDHLPPDRHRAFYNSLDFTLNVTRDDMIRAGHAPSIRLFEAAACAVPIISDRWDGLADLFTPGEEIIIADGTDDVVAALTETSEAERRAIGLRARERVLAAHTAAHRAAELVDHIEEAMTPAARHAAR